MDISDPKLIESYIEPNPHRPGAANARLIGYGVPVWALIGYLEAVHGDVAQLAEDYSVSREAVDAALAYYRKHKALVDARIAANAA